MDIHLGATQWRSEGGKHVPQNATTMEGIFEIQRHASDPKQDTLRWCFAQPSQPRPTSFDVNAGSGHTSVKLQRYIVNEDEIVAKLEQAGATIYKDSDGGWVREIVLPETFDSKVAMQTIPDLRKLGSVVADVADQELIDSLVGHASVKSLRFHSPVASDQLDLLTSSLVHLQELGLRCKEFSEAHCSAILKGESIHTLRLEGNEDDLSGLAMLKGKHIGLLELIDCKPSRTCFERISDNLLTLGFLHITDCQVSPDALTPIARMERLYDLKLTGPLITDEHLLAIKSQTNVRILHINDTAVTHLTLEHVLKNFPHVFSVHAANVAFDRDALDAIALEAGDRQFDLRLSH